MPCCPPFVSSIFCLFVVTRCSWLYLPPHTAPQQQTANAKYVFAEQTTEIVVRPEQALDWAVWQHFDLENVCVWRVCVCWPHGTLMLINKSKTNVSNEIIIMCDDDGEESHDFHFHWAAVPIVCVRYWWTRCLAAYRIDTKMQVFFPFVTFRSSHIQSGRSLRLHCWTQTHKRNTRWTDANSIDLWNDNGQPFNGRNKSDSYMSQTKCLTFLCITSLQMCPPPSGIQCHIISIIWVSCRGRSNVSVHINHFHRLLLSIHLSADDDDRRELKKRQKIGESVITVNDCEWHTVDGGGGHRNDSEGLKVIALNVSI